ncbi:MAG: permease-like cell division protein FtsX [Thermodesulfobacteriota bacterium]|nr:permease-like cell division protein FtsX [Thermodesulfobacteriota bacterium]
MILFFKRAIYDIRTNRFLNAVTIITIALSILIVSSLVLFFVNANDYINSWKKGIRIIAYLKPDIVEPNLVDIKSKIQRLYGVAEVEFISKEEAMKRLREQMKRQSSLLDGLKENPLPDAFEIRLTGQSSNSERIENLAVQIESLPEIDDVEYGRRWIGRFVKLFDLLRLTGYAMSGIFFIAAVFIVANTIRLVIYSRREEIAIMRLVGATDRFIKAPFYIEGIIQGALGGIIGLALLFAAFICITINVEHGLSSGLLHVRFLSFRLFSIIMLCSMLVGWLGCFISLRQFLKE